jgi:hypothetical protein
VEETLALLTLTVHLNLVCLLYVLPATMEQVSVIKLLALLTVTVLPTLATMECAQCAITLHHLELIVMSRLALLTTSA